MSILIKGMEMPKDTCEIRITIDQDGDWWARRIDPDDEWHEVVEVPTPHGRLIDADKLLHDGDNDKGCIDEWINSPGLPDGVKIGIGAVRNLVCYAPTVIEAEE